MLAWFFTLYREIRAMRKRIQDLTEKRDAYMLDHPENILERNESETSCKHENMHIANTSTQTGQVSII